MAAKKPTAKKAAAKKAAPVKKAAKKSGNPRARASGRVTPKVVTSASNWAGKDAKLPHPLELPSGNVCLVQRVGMESFLTGGTIPNSLLPMITESLERAKSRAGSKKKAMSQAEESEMMKLLATDPEKIADMVRLMDAITVGVVIEPAVRLGTYTEEDRRTDPDILPADADPELEGPRVGDKIPFSDRSNDILYADLVDDQDKQFIFNYVVGGSADIERFRAEAAERMALVADV
jgi:hypothetical protein